MLGLELSFVLREVHVTLRQLPFAELMHVIIGLYFSFLRRDAVEVRALTCTSTICAVNISWRRDLENKGHKWPCFLIFQRVLT